MFEEEVHEFRRVTQGMDESKVNQTKCFRQTWKFFGKISKMVTSNSDIPFYKKASNSKV